jgi:hypothetical protein
MALERRNHLTRRIVIVVRFLNPVSIDTQCTLKSHHRIATIAWL